MEKLSPKVVGKAVAVFTGIVSVVCWIFVSIARDGAIWLMNMLAHSLDWGSIAVKPVTFASGIIGLVIWIAIGYILGALFAYVYNKFAQ